jgi:tetratricopeptide (TPR) repeat protein
MHWLSNCSKPWLLVIDNADDPDMDISKYFPAGGKGHILITTRYPKTADQATIGMFHFKGMDPEEAIALLLKSAHVPDQVEHPDMQSRKLAQGIASELGYLALAIAHAGATIRRNIYTLEKYLHYYLGYRRVMMSYPHIQSADDANIITTWEIPFRKLSTRKSVEHTDAVDLLYIFAFVHFESIPESIFQMSWNAVKGAENQLVNYPDILRNISTWGEETHARLRRALRVLCDYSIIDHDPDKGLCSLHPVVHEWARGRLTLSEQKQWAGSTAATLAYCISPNLEASGQGFRRLLLPHVDSCLRALNSLFPSCPENNGQAAELEKFASVYAENGLWKQARELQLKVVSLRVKKLGERHEDTVQARRNFGYICWNLFEIKTAAEEQHQVLMSRWWSRPSLAYWMTWPPWAPDHTSYCIALSDLTLTLWLAGRRDLSKRAGEKAVGGLMKHLGPDDPITLNAMFNLARTYLHIGDGKKSHELLVLVVRKRKRFFGADHPDTLMARNELGLSYRAIGQLHVAERMITNVLEARRKTMGEEHAYTLWSINDLSKILCDRGLPEKAALMLEEIVPVVIRTLGEKHVGMSMTQSNLARAYAIGKKWDKAEVLFHQLTLSIPPDHPDWIHAMSGYVHVRTKQGRLEETEEDCNRILDVILKTKALSPDNPRTLAIAGLLLRIYRAQGRFVEILVLEKRVPGISNHEDSPGGLLTVLYGAVINNGTPRPENTVW